MRRIVLFITAVLLLAGCSQYRRISVNDVAVGSFRFNGTSSASIVLTARVDNPTGHTVSLEEVDAVLLREGKSFVNLTLEGPVSAAPASESKVSIPVLASVLDPVAIITAGLNLKSWDMQDFTVDGRIVVSSDGRAKKTLKLNNVPLQDIVGSLK